MKENANVEKLRKESKSAEAALQFQVDGGKYSNPPKDMKTFSSAWTKLSFLITIIKFPWHVCQTEKCCTDNTANVFLHQNIFA